MCLGEPHNVDGQGRDFTPMAQRGVGSIMHMHTPITTSPLCMSQREGGLWGLA